MRTAEHIDWRHNYERLHMAVTRSGTASELAMLTAENIQLRAAWADARRSALLEAAAICRANNEFGGADIAQAIERAVEESGGGKG